MKTNGLNMIICIFSLVWTRMDLCVIRGPPPPNQPFIRLSWRIKPRRGRGGRGQAGSGGRRANEGRAGKVCVLMHSKLECYLLALLTPSLALTTLPWAWVVSSFPNTLYPGVRMGQLTARWAKAPLVAVLSSHLAKTQGGIYDGGAQRGRRRNGARGIDMDICSCIYPFI